MGDDMTMDERAFHGVPADVPGAERDSEKTTTSASFFAPFVQLDERAGLPTFPLEPLPRALAEWVREASEAEQVTVDVAAILTLVAMSICVMGKAKAGMFGGEPLSLFIVTIDRSGANKSGIFGAALRHVEMLVGRSQSELNGRLAEWEAKGAVLESAVKAIKSDLVKLQKKGDALERGDAEERLKDAIAALTAHADERPRGDVRLCSDITPERLADLLADHRVVAQLSAEGGEVFEGMARYQGDGKGAGKMEVYLKGWKGETLMVDRRNGTQIAVSEPTLTVACVAQPQVLATLRDDGGAREGRGLIGRFLFTVPESRVGRRRLSRARVSAMTDTAYRELLGRLFALPVPAGETPEIPLSDDAWRIAERFYDETERELQPGGELVDVESFASKLRSYLARFAGILHLADGRGVDAAIDGPTMARALTLARYFLAHGCAAHGLMKPEEEVNKALTLWPKLVRLADDGLELLERDVTQKARGRGGLGQTNDVKRALDTLDHAGWLRREERPTGRRPAAWLVLNPHAVGTVGEV